MKVSKDIEVQEWLNRQTLLTEDIRFIKEVQWRTLYYTLLFYVAAASAFQLNVDLGSLYPYAKWASVIIIALVGVAIFIHFMTLAVELDITRLAAGNIEAGLNKLTGIRDECNNMRDKKWRKYRDKRNTMTKWLATILIDTDDRSNRRNGYYYLLYHVPFGFIHLIATAATCIVIAYDK